MSDGMPRDSRGLRPCAWCGGPIDQPKIGRLRAYCRRTCRELAYRERVTQRRIAEAVQRATAPASSVDETPAVPRPRRQLGRGPGQTAAEPLPLWEDDDSTRG